MSTNKIQKKHKQETNTNSRRVEERGAIFGFLTGLAFVAWIGSLSSYRLNINHNQPLSSSSSLQNYHHCYKQVWRAQATLRETACVDCKLHHHATRSVFKTLNFENLKKKKVKLIVNCKLQIAPSCHQVSLQILTF